ncbi:MAG: GspMb/PilO family protein [Vicinamibacterales bacterium]
MNPLLRRAVNEHRNLVVGLSLALLANVLAYILVVRPLEAKSSGAADRAAAAANARRAAERERAQADALVKGKATADQELASFYQKVLPSDMTAARRMTYASLPALARRTGVQYEARTTNIEAVDRDGRLERMTIRMSLQGDYENLRQFIYALESAPEFVIIDGVTLLESQGSEPLSLTLDLSTYYRVRPNAS